VVQLQPSPLAWLPNSITLNQINLFPPALILSRRQESERKLKEIAEQLQAEMDFAKLLVIVSKFSFLLLLSLPEVMIGPIAAVAVATIVEQKLKRVRFDMWSQQLHAGRVAGLAMAKVEERVRYAALSIRTISLLLLVGYVSYLCLSTTR